MDISDRIKYLGISPRAQAQRPPYDLMLQACEYALDGCLRRDPGLAGQALLYLGQALNFGAEKPLAETLSPLYVYCAEQVVEGNFLEAGRMLEQLYTAWRQMRPAGGQIHNLTS